MSYEIWTGTPNEMAPATTAKATLPAALKWCRDHLTDMENVATKFDHAALDSIRSTREQLGQVTSIDVGDRRGWQFTYISVTFRLEIRRTP